MSKNLQKEISSSHQQKRSEDYSTPTSSLHVLNRNGGGRANAVEDEDELKRFQKMANIYERHNYIKNQIEQTK